MKVITVAAQKGGSGKSTIAIHLAVQALTTKVNCQVLLLDMDPQGSVAAWAARRQHEDPIVLQALAGNLSAYLDQARTDQIDYVVIDTPPHAGGTIDAAIRAADLVVIPVRPGPFDLDALGGTVEILRETRTPGLFVLNQVPALGSDGEDAEAVLSSRYSQIRTAQTRLGNRKAFMQSLISGLAINECERASSKAVQEVNSLCQEILTTI